MYTPADVSRGSGRSARDRLTPGAGPGRLSGRGDGDLLAGGPPRPGEHGQAAARHLRAPRAVGAGAGARVRPHRHAPHQHVDPLRSGERRARGPRPGAPGEPLAAAARAAGRRRSRGHGRPLGRRAGADDPGGRPRHAAAPRGLRQPRGLPFPFDLLGAAARPVDVVAGGVALTPAIDDRLARALDRPPTAQRVAPDEAVPGHLFLLPGTASEDELLQAAEGGVWIAALDPLEAFDPGALRFRAVARGARLIAGGALGRALPDLIWEDDLPGILSRVLAVGSELVPVATGAGLFRATTAPMLALVSGSALRPSPD